MFFRIDKESTKFICRSLSFEHSHSVSETTFHSFPKQRRLNSSEEEEVSRLLKVQANKKLVQRHIQITTGRKVTLRDLSNTAAKLRRPSKQPAFTEMIKELQSADFGPSKKIELVVDDDSMLRGIFYQNDTMKIKYKSFPELLMMDTNYKINNLGMPVFLQMIVDGDGLSEIVSVFIVANEDADTISLLVEIFKKENPDWERTETILTDKDFIERAVYGAKFPNAKLQLCLFHVLRSIKREVNVEKLGIGLKQKNLCLEIIQKIAYSHSEVEYQENLDKLVGTGIQSVIDYFNHSWHPIRHEWVIGLKKSCKFNNNTTNRLESVNQKIKQVINRFSTPKQFFEDLEVEIACLRQERDAHIVNTLMKRPNIPYPEDSPHTRFSQLLTPHAYKMVAEQLNLSQEVEIGDIPESNVVTLETSCGPVEVTDNGCSCQYSTMNRLPCRHIFALRAKLKLDLYFEGCISPRWHLNTYQEHYFSSSVESMPSSDVGAGAVSTQEPFVNILPEQPTVLSQSQKYRVAFIDAQKLATLTSEVDGPKYQERLKLLRDLARLWEDDKQPALSLDLEDPQQPEEALSAKEPALSMDLEDSQPPE